MFSSTEYWKTVYEGPDLDKHLDWYCSYSTLRPLITSIDVSYLDSILLLGTGVSSFPDDVYDLGFKDIRIVDGDESVVNLLKKRYNNSKAGIVVQQCQIEKGIPLDEKQRFHIAIDKGLLDGLLCSPTGRSTAEAAVARVWDTLRTPGTWISVSHSCPYERLPIYKVKYWDSIKVFSIRSLGPEDINLDRTEERKLTPFPEDLFDQSQPFDPTIAYVYTFVK